MTRRHSRSPCNPGLEQHAKVILKSEVGGALERQIEQVSAGRSQVSPASWAKIQRGPAYEAMVRTIINHPHLTRAMKGACLAPVA